MIRPLRPHRLLRVFLHDEVQPGPIPAALARFAAEERLSFRQTLMLLDMQKQIVAHRSAKKKDGLESVDWRKFYEGVKEFLEGE